MGILKFKKKRELIEARAEVLENTSKVLWLLSQIKKELLLILDISDDFKNLEVITSISEKSKKRMIKLYNWIESFKLKNANKSDDDLSILHSKIKLKINKILKELSFFWCKQDLSIDENSDYMEYWEIWKLIKTKNTIA